MPAEVKRYYSVLPFIRPGDGAWFAGRKLWSRAIEITSRSPYSHYGKLDIATHDLPEIRVKAGDVVLLDVVETKGGRVANFREEIAAHPSQWHWAPVNTDRYPQYDRQIAAETMWLFQGVQYGKVALLWESFWHLPFIRLAMQWRLKNMDEVFDNTPPYCSMAGAIADLKAGVDPVPDLPARMSTPGDLARSLLYAGNDGSNRKVALVP